MCLSAVLKRYLLLESPRRANRQAFMPAWQVTFCIWVVEPLALLLTMASTAPALLLSVRLSFLIRVTFSINVMGPLDAI